MNKKDIVRFTDEERAICEATIAQEKGKSEKLRRATLLLKADADGPAWNDAKISEAVGCRTQTVENVRRAFVLESDRDAVGATARRVRPLDAAATGRSNRGIGDRRIDQPGDGPSDAKKMA